MPLHYGVVFFGHVAFFTVYEDACNCAWEFNGQVFNLWGLTDGS